jgi:hypothetical protein
MNLHEEQKRVQEAVNNSLAHVQEDPWLAGRVLAGMKGEEHVKRKFSFGIILVVILLVIGSLTTLAAGLEEVNELLYRFWPEAARALRPLNLSVEQGGIRMDVISATMNNEHLLITYSLTDLEGNRINDSTKCSTYLDIPPQIDEYYEHDSLISYDPEKHQALFGSFLEYNGFTPDNSHDDTITFMLAGLTFSESNSRELLPLMDGQEYKVDPVSCPEKLFKTGTVVLDDESARNPKELPKILNPENSLGIPVIDGIELSGIGWVDGMLHIQLHIPDYLSSANTKHTSSEYARYMWNISLLATDPDGSQRSVTWSDEPFSGLLKESRFFYDELNWQDGDALWIEKIFPVSPDDMDLYTVEGSFDTCDMYPELSQYEWRVSFPSDMILMEADK